MGKLVPKDSLDQYIGATPQEKLAGFKLCNVLFQFLNLSFLEPQDVANAVMFLLSEKSGMINGEIVQLEGGYMAGILG